MTYHDIERTIKLFKKTTSLRVKRWLIVWGLSGMCLMLLVTAVCEAFKLGFNYGILWIISIIAYLGYFALLIVSVVIGRKLLEKSLPGYIDKSGKEKEAILYDMDSLLFTDDFLIYCGIFPMIFSYSDITEITDRCVHISSSTDYFYMIKVKQPSGKVRRIKVFFARISEKSTDNNLHHTKYSESFITTLKKINPDVYIRCSVPPYDDSKEN